MTSISHLTMQNRISSFTNEDMTTTSAYSLLLPYLGTIPLGRSSPNLASFQKPLRELYIPYYRQRRDRHHDERRIIISDRDILIFEPDAVSRGKRSLIYASLESIVDIQALELYLMFNQSESYHHKRVRAAFLPIGCEHQERFRSLYSTIDKSQFHLLSTPSSTSCHPPLLLFVMRKNGTSGNGSLLDCHVFAVRRESIAFDLCDMIRRLIVKRTMTPVSPMQHQAPISPQQSANTSATTLLRIRDNSKEGVVQRRTKYLDRDRPISAMEHRPSDVSTNTDMKMNRTISNININDAINMPTNGLTNQLPSPSFFLTNNVTNHNTEQGTNPCHDTSQVLNGETDLRRKPSTCSAPTYNFSGRSHQPQQQQQQQRHFIKASSSTALDESDEVVNDLMNIVVAEKLKTVDMNSIPIPIKRHASFDHTPSNDSNGNTMNKKRFQFHNNNKKRSLFATSNPLPTIISANNTPVISRTTTNVEQQSLPSSEQQQSASILDNLLLRPQVVINRYGDIGNYVPKLLRENIPAASTSMRSSDSNENIFFRATNGHILNGFLNLDFSSKTPAKARNANHNNNNNNNSHYRSSPCLNEDNQERNVLALVQQLRKYQTKAKSHERECPTSNSINYPEDIDDQHNVPSSRFPRATNPSQPSKPIAAAMGGIKVLPLAPPVSYASQRPVKSSHSISSSSIIAASKPRRVASFTIADTELPVNYRQYLRHTDQGVHLYGQEQEHQTQQEQELSTPGTLEHSLGYFP